MQDPSFQGQYAHGTYHTIDNYDYSTMQTTLADFGGTYQSLCPDTTVGYTETSNYQVNNNNLCDSQMHVSLPNSSTSYYKVQMSLARKPTSPELESDDIHSDTQTEPTNTLLTSVPVTTACSSDVYHLNVVSNQLGDHHQAFNTKIENTQPQEDDSAEIKPDSSQPSSTEDIKENETSQNTDSDKSGEVKPPLSYIALIGKSILESVQQRLSLGSIYNWIEKNYPFYKNRGQGWRNSVRHNLSLNDCFIKAGRCEDGKGNYWSIHPANLQDFLRGDFRQRRRSRRRGRKRECDYGYGSPYAAASPTGYYGNPQHAPVSPPYPTATPSLAGSMSSIYSPYSEAERRAYRLDEVLLKQSMNNPFIKWCNNSTCNTNSEFYSPNAGSPNYDVYNNNYSTNYNQWQNSYGDYGNTQNYPFSSSSFSRYVK